MEKEYKNEKEKLPWGNFGFLQYNEVEPNLILVNDKLGGNK